MGSKSMRVALRIVAGLALAVAAQQLARAQNDGTVASASTVAAAVAGDSQTATGNVPRLIKFSGAVTGADGKPATGAVTLTFTLYDAQQEGAALWTETQTAQLDSQGHYSVLLGAQSPAGLPLDVFTSGSALWLGVQPELPGAGELPRVLLVAVPYALKAADADTLGGKPASAYVLSPDQGQTEGGNLAVAASQAGQRARSEQRPGTSKTDQTNGAASGIGGVGTPNYIPIWAGSQTLGNSVLFQKLSQIGLGTTTPSAKLDSYGTGITVRGTSSGANGTGVVGNNTATTGYANGVYGQSASSSGSGISGISTATSGFTSGVYGQAASANGTGVFGFSPNWVGVGGQTVNGPLGVWGDNANTSGAGVAGYEDATSGYTSGVSGTSARRAARGSAATPAPLPVTPMVFTGRLPVPMEQAW